MDEPNKDNELELLLCDYLDGQLGARRQAKLEKRLAADPELREELRKYAALDGHLAELAGGEVEGVDYERQRAEIVAAVERKVLLDAPIRRPILLRPAFGALAAAAVLLLAVGAGWLLLRPPAPPDPAAASVSVEVLRSTPAPSGVVEVSMQFSPVGLDELVVDPDASTAAGAPGGSIVVSVGAGPTRRPRPAMPMVIY